MKQQEPKVSICVTSYNHSRFLPTALESALSQTYRNFDIIIADDGSTDGSTDIAEDYARRYPAIIKFYQHPGGANRGVAATHNLAINQSRGAYIARLESDDVLFPNSVQLQAEFLDTHPGVGLVYGRATIIDSSGRGTGQEFGAAFPPLSDPAMQLIQANPIPSPTVMIRRVCIEHTQLFDDSLIYSDWEMWIRILSVWRVGFIDQALAYYRIHGSNLSIGQRDEVNLERELAVLLALKDKSSVVGGSLCAPRTRALLDLALSSSYFRMGDLALAQQNLASAFAVYPKLGRDYGWIAQWINWRWRDVSIGHGAKVTYGSWVVEHLPPKDTDSIRRWLAALKYANLAFDSYAHKDLGDAQKAAIRCLRTDIRWLRNRSIISVLLETILGSGSMARVRSVKGRLLDQRH